MSTPCFQKILTLAARLLTLFVALAAAFFTNPAASAQSVICIDPGHGGQDTGARGAGGLLEKDVVLALAKRIENRLGPECSVRLSRSDDYSLELFNRTETANSQNAGLFLGLHAGGAFNYSTGGPAVYYYLDSPGRILPDEEANDAAADQSTGRTPWHSVQYRHSAESRILAQFLQASLAGMADASECRMVGAPLLELSAANMPAVLLEVGCLNNPAEEEKLASPDYLDRLAQAIAGALKSYLGRTADITSIDLRD